jgi:Fe2+ transport system protein FeoA
MSSSFATDATPLSPASLTLASLSTGQTAQILALLNHEAELTLLRFGLGVGDSIRVLSKLPQKGPLICYAHDMEFALGFDYANSILVQIEGETP